MTILHKSPNGSLGKLTTKVLTTYQQRLESKPGTATNISEWHTIQASLEAKASEAGKRFEALMAKWRVDRKPLTAIELRIARIEFQASNQAAREHRLSKP